MGHNYTNINAIAYNTTQSGYSRNLHTRTRAHAHTHVHCLINIDLGFLLQL